MNSIIESLTLLGLLIIKEIHTPENKGISSSLIEETNSYSFFTTDCTTSTQDPAEPPLLKFKIVENPINSVYIPRSIILKGAIFFFFFHMAIVSGFGFTPTWVN